MNQFYYITGSGLKGGLRTSNSTNTGADALDEGLGGEEETNKPVLVIPFDMNVDTSVGFLSEQKVMLHFKIILIVYQLPGSL